MDLEIKKRRVTVALLLVAGIVVLLYFAGLFTETPPKVRGLGGFIEPETVTSGSLVRDLSIEPAEVEVDPKNRTGC